MSRHDHHLPWAEYLATLKPHERPMMPGSPASPDHPWPRRLHYGLVGVLIALNGSLGNAAVTANLPQLAGALGITTTEAAWLPIVFVMTNASMSLLLIKFRMQYGLRLFTLIILPAFVAVSLAHLFVTASLGGGGAGGGGDERLGDDDPGVSLPAAGVSGPAPAQGAGDRHRHAEPGHSAGADILDAAARPGRLAGGVSAGAGAGGAGPGGGVDAADAAFGADQGL